MHPNPIALDYGKKLKGLAKKSKCFLNYYN